MKDIVFETETISREIEPNKSHSYIFKGINLSNKEIKRTTFESSCSCTASNPPKVFEPNKSFEIEMIFDPKGDSGFYAKSIKFKLDNGQEIKLRINGKINPVE